MTKVPPKYQPDDCEWEDKQWLYEHYWEQLLPLRELAEMCDTSHHQIRKALDKHNIPRRPDNWTQDNNVSPFAGFYNDQNARTERDYYEDCHPDEPTDWGCRC